MQQNQPTRHPLAIWKWITMIILLYVFIAGWFVPLHPGIIEVTPDRGYAGDSMRLEITGYNSTYTSGTEAPRVWLRLAGDTVIQAYAVHVEDNRRMAADFYIPSVMPVFKNAYSLSLVIDHPVDGTSVLPSALFLLPSKHPVAADVALWDKHKIDQVHTNKAITFPFRNILSETIRNTYFHVPMWFSMIVLFGVSAWYSLRYYRKGDMSDDNKSVAYVRVGLLFGVMGMITGMIWAKFTWNEFWSWDVKQNMSAIALLIYAALMVMRSSIEDDMQKARLTAGYNMFAFVLLIPLLFIIPRMTDSLHPGNGGNPAFGGEDLDNTMRMVFYPAVIGWVMLGLWISQLVFRADKLKLTT